MEIWNIIYNKLETSKDRYNLSITEKCMRKLFIKEDWIKLLTSNWERKARILDEYFDEVIYPEILKSIYIKDKIIFYHSYKNFKNKDVNVNYVNLFLYKQEFNKTKRKVKKMNIGDLNLLSIYNFPLEYIFNLIDDMNKIAICICRLHS